LKFLFEDKKKKVIQNTKDKTFHILQTLFYFFTIKLVHILPSLVVDSSGHRLVKLKESARSDKLMAFASRFNPSAAPYLMNLDFDDFYLSSSGSFKYLKMEIETK
jgi:hypothetical protein